MFKYIKILALIAVLGMPVFSYAAPFVATDASNSLAVQTLDQDAQIHSNAFVATDASNSLAVQKLSNNNSEIECFYKPFVATDASNSLVAQRLSDCDKS